MNGQVILVIHRSTSERFIAWGFTENPEPNEFHVSTKLENNPNDIIAEMA